MKARDIFNEDGRIVKGVNTTADVGPNEIKIQAAKFGNTVDKDGVPPTLSKKVKGASTNVAFNLGLTEGFDPVGWLKSSLNPDPQYKAWKKVFKQNPAQAKKMFRSNHREYLAIYQNESISEKYNKNSTEQPVTTSNLKTGVTTTVNKAANRVTQQSDAGTTVKDRTGGVRSIQTPKIGGFQAKQTFRPDATPGYQQATYTKGPTTLDIKGSPETGFTKSAKFSAGGMDVKQTQRYSGQKQTDASLNLGKGEKARMAHRAKKK